MPNHHRRALWWVSAAHLVAAAATWFADVPVATPFTLTLAAVIAFALGLTEWPPSHGKQEVSLRGHLGDGQSITDSVADEELTARSSQEEKTRRSIET